MSSELSDVSADPGRSPDSYSAANTRTNTVRRCVRLCAFGMGAERKAADLVRPVKVR